MDFILKEEYIELIKLLKITKIAQTGGHAKIMVEEGEIMVNNKTETRKRAKIREGDTVSVGENKIYIRK